MEKIEYVARTADNGEFVPVLATDRFDALRQLEDVSLDSLYMESKSPDTALSSGGKYDSHLVRLKDGTYFILEQEPQPTFERNDVDKVFVDVQINEAVQ